MADVPRQDAITAAGRGRADGSTLAAIAYGPATTTAAGLDNGGGSTRAATNSGPTPVAFGALDTTNGSAVASRAGVSTHAGAANGPAATTATFRTPATISYGPAATTTAVINHSGGSTHPATPAAFGGLGTTFGSAVASRAGVSTHVGAAYGQGRAIYPLPARAPGLAMPRSAGGPAPAVTAYSPAVTTTSVVPSHACGSTHTCAVYGQGSALYRPPGSALYRPPGSALYRPPGSAHGPAVLRSAAVPTPAYGPAATTTAVVPRATGLSTHAGTTNGSATYGPAATTAIVPSSTGAYTPAATVYRPATLTTGIPSRTGVGPHVRVTYGSYSPPWPPGIVRTITPTPEDNAVAPRAGESINSPICIDTSPGGRDSASPDPSVDGRGKAINSGASQASSTTATGGALDQ